MDPLLGPLLAHWPFVRRHLEMSRRRPAAIGLDALARFQDEAGGEPVELGAARFMAEGLTAGEAAAVLRELRELVARGVVVRFRGAGRRPDAWSLRGGLAQWRAMPWVGAARDVDRPIRACACATFGTVVAQNPGQSVDPRRQFWLSLDDHTRPPGLFLVDSRDNRAGRATTVRRPGPKPVDSRGNGHPAGAPYLSLGGSFGTSSSSEEEDKVVTILQDGVRRATGGLRVWPTSKLMPRLLALAATLSVAQAALVADRLAAERVNGERPRHPATAVDLAVDIARSNPAVLALAEEA